MIVVTLMGLSLTACGNNQPPPSVQLPAQPPVIVSQPAPVQMAAPAPQSGMGDLVTGAAIGALATHALSNNNRQPQMQMQMQMQPAYAQPPRVVHRTTVVQQKIIVRQAPRVVQRPAPRPAPARVSLSKGR